MGLAYLKVAPETAIQSIDDCIVKGYELKDRVINEFMAAENLHGVESGLPVWRQLLDEWTTSAIHTLDEIFVSRKEQYNFRDAPVSPLSLTGWNAEADQIRKVFDARISKLNDYDENIRNNFRVNLEIVMRDKIVQSGNGGNDVKTKN